MSHHYYVDKSKYWHYKGYAGTAVWCPAYKEYVGELENARELVMYHAKTIHDTELAFREAVDAYADKFDTIEGGMYDSDAEWYASRSSLERGTSWEMAIILGVFRGRNRDLWERDADTQTRLTDMANQECNYIYGKMAIEGARYDTEKKLSELCEEVYKKYEKDFDLMRAETEDWKELYRTKIEAYLRSMRALEYRNKITDKLLDYAVRNRKSPISIAWDIAHDRLKDRAHYTEETEEEEEL